MKLQMSSIVAGRALQKDFPQQVEKLVWVRAFSPIVIQDGEAGEIEHLRMADGNLFEILKVPFVRGTAATALPDTNSIALSETEAKRRFGTVDPIGKTLTIVANGAMSITASPPSSKICRRIRTFRPMLSHGSTLVSNMRTAPPP
jgi:putative ABC transport system permease protein